MKDTKREAVGLRAEVELLKKEVSSLQTEIEKITKIEKSLGYHELVLAKKVRDVNELNGKLSDCLTQDHLKQIRKGLHKVERHEEMLFESARYIKEVIKELDKVRESQLVHVQNQSTAITNNKKESDDRMEELHGTIKNMNSHNDVKRVEIANNVKHLERILADRLSQVEYQNKLIMKYLKRIDESIFK